MARYRVKIGLVKSGVGFSEQYISPDLTDPTITVGVLQAMIDARLAMLPPQYEITQVRIGIIGGYRRSKPFLPGAAKFFDTGVQLHVPGNGTYVPEVVKAPRSGEQDVFQLELRYDITRFTRLFLTGAPNLVLSDRPFSFEPDLAPNWNGAYNTFRYGLSGAAGGFPGGAWSVRAKVPIPVVPLTIPPTLDPWAITAWTYKTPSSGIIGATIFATGNPNISQGDKIHVYGSRTRVSNQAFGGRAPNVNGNWLVDSVNLPTTFPGPATYYLRGTSGFDPTSFKVLGRLFPVYYTYYNILDAEGKQAGTHKRGKPSGLPAGRRLTRVSQDP